MATVPSRTCCQKKCHFTWKYFVRLVMRWFTARRSALLCLEDLTLDRRRERARKFDAGGDFLEHGTERQERTHRGAESGVFGFERGQGNLTLEVRPQNGTSAERDDVPSSRLRGGRRTIGIAAMKACEVGVDVTVEIQVPVGLTIMPMSLVRCKYRTRVLTADAWLRFGLWQNLATWLTANAMSGRVFVDK
ncbi:hypothetical protein MHU86_17592 [Fragilaria crotonensis]|nr:hypothetical protein MHU86_17592 [Fragilaria crotonensis]